MRARLIKIGNSMGIRLPKAVIRQAGLVDELDLQVSGDTIIVRPMKDVRSGWEAAAIACDDAGESEHMAWDAVTDDFAGDWE